MHRDIKSDNVLISASGEAKLADFGCSKRIGTTAAVGGGNGAGYQTLVGSPFFMAPEVMSGSDEGYSYPADIWSVGCLVLELLGREPWSIPPTSNVFQIMFHISKSNSMPSGIPKKCPKMLYNFFERVFDRDPAKRASAEELLKHEWFHCPDNQLEEVPLDD
ncbi:hypothetical protein AGDE_13736 [Angomonas deanei]|uniref:Protein tyrosine kinase/Protein kinase domain containing protein, putative n=1 Tax=Angomonas deanei TaxID=59799 RepID=A0A7G2CRU7_9TRYP|nr:hypothetical protein AGDE_13736 [Angomonas deanei]CAD2221721.1 Protein tyrosine kinase/Protein kinase domain containing protein, putative [Angomonas deanei]|eukprot:EPY21803.1 hypothetical protein AGDE_13736 [Angomonas deanei]